MALLEVIGLGKTYNHKPALDNVTLAVEAGNILCLLGPSGCGKTTLLRIIAGLERPDHGRVIFDGRDIGGLSPHRRRFGMMFQEFALFPHKNVFENVAFGLRMQNLPYDEIARRTEEMLALVGLTGFTQRNVGELSGGERQRVALARSLAPQPRLLMLDEPLGALDRSLRERLMADIRRILKEVGLTAIFVTHDQAEAFAVADAVAVIDRGRIEQLDRPENLYRSPANPTVARFLGFHNLIDGSIENGGNVKTAVGTFSCSTEKHIPGHRVTVLIRPEAAGIATKDTPPDDRNPRVAGVVKDRLFQGRYYQVSLETEAGLVLIFDLPHEPRPPRPGQMIDLVLKSEALVLETKDAKHP